MSVYQCICVSVCGHSHSRISWSIFAKIGTDVRTSKREKSSLGVNIALPLPYFASSPTYLGQEVLKTHANIKLSYVHVHVR